jgi:hypothetical protein
MHSKETMMKMKCFTFLAICACVCASARLWAAADDPAAADEDAITLYVNAPIPPGKIVQDDYGYVAIQGKGPKLQKKTFEVKDVQHGDACPDFQEGLRKLEIQKYTVAAKYFVDALGQMGKQKWAAEYCNYYAGFAIYTNGDTSKFLPHKGASGTEYVSVSDYFKKTLEANPKSRFLPDLLGKIPIALAEEGKLDEAEAKVKEAKGKLDAYYNEVKALDSKGYAPIKERAEGQIAIAEALIAEKKGGNADQTAWQEVADKWGSAYGKCERAPELRAQALDGQLRALNSPKLKGSGYDSAITLAEEVIERYNSSGERSLLPSLPAAYTGLGNAKFSKAMEAESKKQIPQAQRLFAEARWAFVHVVAQFFDVEEYVAEAHFYAGYCYDKLQSIEPDAAEKAGRHWSLIVKNFPTSKFKDLADKKLKEIAAASPAPAPEKAPEKK